MSSILLHCCCGPCAAYVVKQLRQDDLEPSALWYNPNIHPFTEHQMRLASMQSLAGIMDLPLIAVEGYGMVDYFREVTGHEANRCPDCYRMRLQKTAQIARENNIAAFSTTLLISPYQNQEMLREIGEEAGRDNGVRFHFQDFRSGFRESQELARELGLYRQKYCGCLFSEYERFAKVKIT